MSTGNVAFTFRGNFYKFYVNTILFRGLTIMKTGCYTTHYRLRPNWVNTFSKVKRNLFTRYTGIITLHVSARSMFRIHLVLIKSLCPILHMIRVCGANNQGAIEIVHIIQSLIPTYRCYSKVISSKQPLTMTMMLYLISSNPHLSVRYLCDA